MELHYTTLASEQSILTLAPTFQRKLLPPSPHGKGTSRYRNMRTGARAVIEAMGDSGLKNENRQETFLRWEEAAPSRTLLEETLMWSRRFPFIRFSLKGPLFHDRWSFARLYSQFLELPLLGTPSFPSPMATYPIPTHTTISLLPWRHS